MGMGSRGGKKAPLGENSPKVRPTISENLSRFSRFPLSEHGYFGVNTKKSSIRILSSEDPKNTAQNFFEELTHGMPTKPLANGKGVFARSSDGYRIVYRPKSSSSDASPAIEIWAPVKNITGLATYQKIHFTQK